MLGKLALPLRDEPEYFLPGVAVPVKDIYGRHIVVFQKAFYRPVFVVSFGHRVKRFYR